MVSIFLTLLLGLNCIFAQDKPSFSEQNYRVNTMMFLLSKNPGLTTELYPQDKRTAFFDILEKIDLSTNNKLLWKEQLAGIESEGISMKEIQPLNALFRFFGDDTKAFFLREWTFAHARATTGPTSFITRKSLESLGQRHATFAIKLEPYTDVWGYVRVLPVREKKDGSLSSVYINFHTNMKVRENENVFFKVLYMVQEVLKPSAVYADKLLPEMEKNKQEVYIEYDASGRENDVKETKYKVDQIFIRDQYLNKGENLKSFIDWSATVGEAYHPVFNDALKFPLPDNLSKWRRALMLSYYLDYIESSKSYPGVISEKLGHMNSKNAYYWGLIRSDLEAVKVIVKGELGDRINDKNLFIQLNSMGFGIEELSYFLKNDPNDLMTVYNYGIYKDEKTWDKFFTRLTQNIEREILVEEKDNYSCSRGLYNSFLALPQKYWLDTYVKKLEAARSSTDHQYKATLVSAASSLTELPDELWAIITEYSELQVFSDVLEHIKVWPLDFWKRQLPQIIKKGLVTWWVPLAAQKEWPDAFRVQVVDLMEEHPQLLLALKNQEQLTEAEWQIVARLMKDPKIPTVYFKIFLAAQKQLTSDVWNYIPTFIEERGLDQAQVNELLNNKIESTPSFLIINNTGSSKNMVSSSYGEYQGAKTLEAELIFYKLYFTYKIMDDVELELQLKRALNNYMKDYVDVTSKQQLLDAYEIVLQNVVPTLLGMKTKEAYVKKISALTKDGSIDLYALLTEYICRNHKNELTLDFTNYDGLNIRNNKSFILGFLGKYPLGYSETDDASDLYAPAIRELINKNINPSNIFDTELLQELKVKAIEMEEEADFEELFDVVNKEEPTTTQAKYSAQKIREVLLSGKTTVADVEPLTMYVQDMLKEGKLSNAKAAILALDHFGEDVTTLNEELKSKQDVLIPSTYYETSDIPKYKAALKYMDITEEEALRMTEAEIVYKGLVKVVGKININYGINREDANFLNDAIFPYMFAKIDLLAIKLKSDSTGKVDKESAETTLLSYVSGVNILSEIMIAAPTLITAGLRNFSKESFKTRRDYVFKRAEESVTKKAEFKKCLKDYDDYVRLYDFTDEVKRDFFIKGY